MALEKLNQIRERIQSSRMKPERKEEIGKLLDELEKELNLLPAQARDDARALMDLADRSTKGAIESGDAVPLQPLRETIQNFEISCPGLTRVLNRICSMLSGIGI
ncbi:MAG: DUF4404 family protein [Victivallales bacterium]